MVCVCQLRRLSQGPPLSLKLERERERERAEIKVKVCQDIGRSCVPLLVGTQILPKHFLFPQIPIKQMDNAHH